MSQAKDTLLRLFALLRLILTEPQRIATLTLNENIRLHAPQACVDEVRERLNLTQALYQKTHASQQLQPA